MYVADAPILLCKKCGFEECQTRSGDIDALAESAISRSERGVFRRHFLRKFNFCEGIAFEYDSRDYDYIPGLWREWDEGYLTPVFFSRSVLHKYANRTGYSVTTTSDTYGHITLPDGIHFDFGVNGRGEIILWLGDIDKLPITEQRYLFSENVSSSHDIGSSFYDAQIMAEFTDLSVEQRLFRNRARFVHCFMLVVPGSTQHLGQEAREILRAFSAPLDNDEATILNAIHSIEKVCIETLRKGDLAKALNAGGYQVADENWGSLKLLEQWVDDVLEIGDAHSILSPFFYLYELRQLKAHLLGAATQRELVSKVKQGLAIPAESTLPLLYSSLLTSLADSYEVLYKAVASKFQVEGVDDIYEL